MLTKDDLKAIADTMNPLIKAEGESTKKDLKNYIAANNSILSNIVRIDILAQNKDTIEVVKAGFQEVGKLIKEVKEEIHDERVQNLEERVRKLEKQLSQAQH